MNNYPTGAAHDPNAPYNQEDTPEIDVTVKQMLVKQTCIVSRSGHYEYDVEYDSCEGRNVASQYWESGNLEEDFRKQCRTAVGCLLDCCRVLAALKQAGISRVAHVNIDTLLDDCEGWEHEELEVSED